MMITRTSSRMTRMRAPPTDPPITEAATCKEVVPDVEEEGIEVVGMAVRQCMYARVHNS